MSSNEPHLVDTRPEAPDADRDAVALFLHGNPDSSQLWDRVIETLRPSIRCLAPDLPGFGKTPAGDFPAALDADPLTAMADWVDRVLERAGIRAPSPIRVHVVAHDLGGPFGFAWAIRHPERVASLAGLDTLFFSRYRWHFWARVWRAPLLGELSMRLLGERLFRFEVRRGSSALPDEHLRRTWELVTPEAKRMVLRLYRATDPEIFRGAEDELRALAARVPSLALWGARDPYIAPRWAAELGCRRVVILPDVGHWTPVEAPGAVAGHLRELFASTGSR